VHRDLLGILLGHLLHPDRAERAVLEDGEVREQVEVLEHHADLAADLVDLLEVVGQLDAVDDDRPCWCSSSRLMQRIMVDLPEPEGPQMTMRSPRSP
jgi:23S rRNA A2030 N6-methylase RlmJ